MCLELSLSLSAGRGHAGGLFRRSVGLRNFASSESLPGVCPDPQRQGALDAEPVVSGPTKPDLCPYDRDRGRARRASDSARG